MPYFCKVSSSDQIDIHEHNKWMIAAAQEGCKLAQIQNGKYSSMFDHFTQT